MATRKRGPSDTHLPDPTQLPIVDVAHQTSDMEAPDSLENPPIFADKRVAAWIHMQGPRRLPGQAHKCLNPTWRGILNQLGEFVNPATGEAWPSQVTLARLMGIKVGVVNRVLKGAEELGYFTITKRLWPGSNWRHNVYRFAGIDSAWQVTEEKGHESAIMSADKARIADLERQLSVLRAAYVEMGLELPQGIEMEVPDNFTERESATKERDSDSYYFTESESVNQWEAESLSLEEISVALAESDTVPNSDPVAELVDANLERLLEGGWNHRGGILRVFRQDPAEMERWRRILEEEESEAQELAAEEPDDRELNTVTGSPDSEAPKLRSSEAHEAQKSWHGRSPGKAGTAGPQANVRDLAQKAVRARPYRRHSHDRSAYVRRNQMGGAAAIPGHCNDSFRAAREGDRSGLRLGRTSGGVRAIRFDPICY